MFDRLNIRLLNPANILTVPCFNGSYQKIKKIHVLINAPHWLEAGNEHIQVTNADLSSANK